MEQRKSEAEVALELMRLVLEHAGSRRLSPTRTLALYHLCKEAVLPQALLDVVALVEGQVEV